MIVNGLVISHRDVANSLGDIDTDSAGSLPCHRPTEVHGHSSELPLPHPLCLHQQQALNRRNRWLLGLHLSRNKQVRLRIGVAQHEFGLVSSLVWLRGLVWWR